MQVTLRAARVNAGLTQTEAAESLGITRNTLCRWELGKSFPTVPQIQRIEKVYNVSYDSIIFLPQTTLKA